LSPETRDPRPALVTGATGFVGSHLVERLLEAGFRVRCLVRKTSALGNLPKHPGLELAYGDVGGNAGLDAAVAGARIVFHAAGVTKALGPKEYYRGNVEGTRHLLRACAEAAPPPERFVHVSSLAAIGPGAETAPVGDDAEPRPLTHYGRSKLGAECAVRQSALAAQATIVRPAVVYGPRDTDVLHLFRAARQGLLVRIGREESLAAIIYVKDLADLLLAAALAPQAAGRSYFGANPDPVTWDELAGCAAAVMGRRLKSVSIPAGAAWLVGLCAEQVSRMRGKPGIISREKVAEARCRYWTCDTSGARRDLGFSPRYSIRAGVAETLAWYREQGWLAY
jgi:dihydroflavonol-4-reductase